MPVAYVASTTAALLCVSFAQSLCVSSQCSHLCATNDLTCHGKRSIFCWRCKQVSCFTCRAPEQTDTDFGPRGSHTNVWGFATAVLHLATGQLPYHGLTQCQMFTSMMRRRPPAVPDTLPAWLQQHLKQCLDFDVTKRPSAPALLKASHEMWTLC